MSLQVISYRDDFFPGPTDAATWRQLTNAFGIEAVKFVDDGTVTLDPETVIVFDETGEIPLTDFEHPQVATYVFGCTAMRNIQSLYPGAPSVRIEIPKLIFKQGLFGCQAAAIVLYDRERKRWR